MSENTYKINQVPSITWNWLKSNNDTVTFNTSFEEKKSFVKEIPSGFEISDFKSAKGLSSKDFSSYSGVFNISSPKQKDRRAIDGKEISEPAVDSKTENLKSSADNFIDSSVTSPEFIKITGKTEKPLVLNFEFTVPSVSEQYIYALKDSSATVIFVYSGNAETSITQTKILAEENAELHVIKVQMLGNKALFLDDTTVKCHENSSVKFTQIELGGLHVDSGLHTLLSGNNSQFKSNVAYLVQNNQYLDMNHIVYHTGKKTVCDMSVNGSLKDNAVKVYRGTIDLKKGCSGAKGNEMEESLVLSPATVNKSLPVILCDEDDVEGEHGSTIGRLSSDILFYMQTRGISEEQAQKIMSRAKIQAATDTIPDEEIKTKISQWLDSNS
jgi:Fe-S cluster assembly protein SufD